MTHSLAGKLVLFNRGAGPEYGLLADEDTVVPLNVPAFGHVLGSETVESQKTDGEPGGGQYTVVK